MPRTTDNPKNKTVCVRMTDEMRNAVLKFAEDTDTTLSSAVCKAIEYGILYYYYEKED
jgi:predicted DNA-binding protein